MSRCLAPSAPSPPSSSLSSVRHDRQVSIRALETRPVHVATFSRPSSSRTEVERAILGERNFVISFVFVCSRRSPRVVRRKVAPLKVLSFSTSSWNYEYWKRVNEIDYLQLYFHRIQDRQKTQTFGDRRSSYALDPKPSPSARTGRSRRVRQGQSGHRRRSQLGPKTHPV